MTVTGDKEYRSAHRILTLQACFVAFGLMVAMFLVWTQWLSRLFEPLSSVSAAPAVSVARRGSIVDRNGHPLAFDVYQYTVGVSPAEMGPDSKTRLSNELATILNMNAGTLRSMMDSTDAYVTLAKRVEQSSAQALRDLRDRGYPIKLDSTPVRYHPERALAAHVLGFVNNDGKGCYGVEAYYEQLLSSTSSSASDSAQQPPQLVLTIDRVLQQLAEEELDRGLRKAGSTSGQIIVMNPSTGEILALASLPTYDPDRWLSFTPETWENPCVARLYEPGSVFKTVTYSGAIESGTVTADTRYYDPGVIEYGGARFSNWDLSSHDSVTVVQAIGKSLNTVAVQVARDMGKDLFYASARKFGYGQTCEVDLANEVAGVLKTPSDGAWSDPDLATNSFGQGLSATPLQVIAAVSSLANGGVEMLPHVVKARIVNGKTEEVQPVPARRTVSLQTARTMSQILTTAVETELQHAKVPGYWVAGKTGTSQIPIAGMYHPTDTIASFVGWAPVEQPALIILVKVDRPQAGSTGTAVAVPIFRAVCERALQVLQVPPTREID